MGCSASKGGKSRYPKSYFDTYSQNKQTKDEKQTDQIFSSDNILIKKKKRDVQQNQKKHLTLNHTNINKEFILKPQQTYSDEKILRLTGNGAGVNQDNQQNNVQILNEQKRDDIKQEDVTVENSKVFQEYQQHMQKIKEERIKYKNTSFHQYQSTVSNETKLNNRSRRGLSGNLFRKYGQKDQQQQQQLNRFDKTDISSNESPLKRKQNNNFENNLILNNIFNKNDNNQHIIDNNSNCKQKKQSDQITINNLMDETKDHTTTIKEEENIQTNLKIRDSQVNCYPSRQYFKTDKLNQTQLFQQQQSEQNVSIQLNGTGTLYPQIQQPQQQQQLNQHKKGCIINGSQKNISQSNLSVKTKNKQLKSRKSVDFNTSHNSNNQYKNKPGKRKELNLQEVHLSNNQNIMLQQNILNNNNFDQINKTPIQRNNDRKETLDLKIDEQEYMYIKRKGQNNNQINNKISRHRINSGSSFNFNNISSIQSPFIQASAFSEQLNF